MTKSTTMRTLGLDLGDLHVHYALVDSNGELLEEGRVRTTSPDLQSLVHKLNASHVVLEASTHSPWIDRELRAEGVDVRVVNPNRLRAVSDSVRKTDRNDARLLARLGHAGVLLWEVHHRSKEAQRSLQLVTARDKVVGCRTTLINQVRGQVKSLGYRLRSVQAPRFHTLREDALEINPDLETLFDVIETLTTKINDYDARLLKIAQQSPVASLLMTVPGVGPITALAFMYVLDDPSRFPRCRQVPAYIGLTPRIDQSGNIDKALPISKAGNGLLRRLLVSAGMATLRQGVADSALRDWGLRIMERGGQAAKKRAAVAVARKLAVILHRMWVTTTPWIAYPEQESATAG